MRRQHGALAGHERRQVERSRLEPLLAREAVAASSLRARRRRGSPRRSRRWGRQRRVGQQAGVRHHHGQQAVQS
jgi:hypothetical protein